MTISDSMVAILRKRAGLTQSRLAERMGVTQGTVSKWETDPSGMTLLQLESLAKHLGVPISQLLRQPPPTEPAIRYSGEYESLDQKVRLLRDYCNAADGSLLAGVEGSQEIVREIKTLCARYLRKPIVGVAGMFDSGKSTLINHLLGSRALPTGYQPMTALPTLVVHASHKPRWMTQHEDVLVLPSGEFDSMLSADELPTDRIAMTGIESLQDLASHRGDHPKMRIPRKPDGHSSRRRPPRPEDHGRRFHVKPATCPAPRTSPQHRISCSFVVPLSTGPDRRPSARRRGFASTLLSA